MRLGPKARVLLDLLFMSGLELLESSSKPPLSILNAGGWTSEENFDRHLAELYGEGWIDWDRKSKGESWVLRITDLGKETLMESIDPEASWSQKWDGKWRTLTFDLPRNARKERRQLDSWLRKNRFGHLQGSVWISHRPYREWSVELRNLNVKPSSVLFQECVPLGHQRSQDYVSSAWDFDKINERYQSHIAFLESSLHKVLKYSVNHANWLRNESASWKQVFQMDPFLSKELLPSGYLGRVAWNKRRETFQLLGEHLISTPNPQHRIIPYSPKTRFGNVTKTSFWDSAMGVQR
jgi:DNA-binding transcriptional regulator PaaX